MNKEVGKVTVVGLGPAGPELIPPLVTEAMAAAGDHLVLRTTRHPAASVAAGARSFDAFYERAERIEDVYADIVEAIVAEAATGAKVVYAVPGSPLVAEHTVDLLRADLRVEVEVLPAMSFLDLAWAALGVDPLAAGVRLVDGHRFAVEAAGERGPLLVAQCDSSFVLSDVKLALDETDGVEVVVLQRLGLQDQSVRTIAWEDLDRVVDADHLTSLWIPNMAAPVGAEMARFGELVRTLRERCPWDREQTHETLVRYLVEETYETVEAIESGDPAHVEEELGDLLFQVVFHATIGAEAGEFTLADVARGIHDKLVARHPHVFGDVEATTAGEVASNWDAIKREEKQRESVLDGIPNALPALSRAAKVGRRAASTGFDWATLDGPMAKVDEELAELREALGTPAAEAELGDLLFSIVNVARHLGLDPEQALRRATDTFASRFRAVEALSVERDVPILDEALWDEVKRSEKR